MFLSAEYRAVPLRAKGPLDLGFDSVANGFG
jgi:hypothetical protein